MTILKESWQSLINPANIDIKEGYNDLTKSVITMEPFARGYGHTLGNALRRVMLSSITGFAVTSIRIEGILHEYSSVDGVKEDVLDIIMNLKSLAIRKEDSSPCTVKLSSNKPGPVYAGSLDLPSGVEVINKDLLICTINKDASIDMQIGIESGRGYSPAEKLKKNADNVVGLIAIDAIFSPVKSVSYKVENARVGQVTDFDVSQYEVQSNVEVDDEPDFNRNLIKTIDELELSVRSYNCLKNENIIYVGDLVSRTEAEMLKTANFGRKSLNELRENLSAMNLSFGMKLSVWPPKNIDELLKVKNKEF